MFPSGAMTAGCALPVAPNARGTTMNSTCIDPSALSAACLAARSLLMGKARREADAENVMLDAYAAHCVSRYAVCLCGPHLESLSKAFARAHPKVGSEETVSLLSDFLSCTALEQARQDIGRHLVRLGESYHDPVFIASAVRAAGKVGQKARR